MNGPADRSVRLILMLAGTWLAVGSIVHVADPCIAPPVIDDLTIDVNADPPERLRLLPGIGPAIARQVLAERQLRSFRDMDDFTSRVRGIGPTFVANFGGWVSFDQQPIVFALPGKGREPRERPR